MYVISELCEHDTIYKSRVFKQVPGHTAVSVAFAPSKK